MSSWQNWKYKRVPSLLAAFMSCTEPYLSVYSYQSPLNQALLLCDTLDMVQPWYCSFWVCAIEFLYWFIAACVRTCLEEHSSRMLACSMTCWQCPTCCMCSPFLSPTIGDTTHVLHDQGVAILVFWPVSTHHLVTGSSLVGIVVCCGGCGFSSSNCYSSGNCGSSSWPATWNVFAHRTTSRASTFIDSNLTCISCLFLPCIVW